MLWWLEDPNYLILGYTTCVKGVLLANGHPSRMPIVAHISQDVSAAALDGMEPVPDKIRDVAAASPIPQGMWQMHLLKKKRCGWRLPQKNMKQQPPPRWNRGCGCHVPCGGWCVPSEIVYVTSVPPVTWWITLTVMWSAHIAFNHHNQTIFFEFLVRLVRSK